MAVAESPTVDQPPDLRLYALEVAEMLLRVVDEHRPPERVRQLAACRGQDPDVFVPPHPSTVRAEALRWCARCPVAAECREWARAQGPSLWGTWGGEGALGRRRG